MSPYGVPRWIGALLSVLGSRASEEVNFLYFDNKAIPPMVLLCSGGRVAESNVEKIENVIEERVKGRKNFHKIIVIEALPADAKETAGDIEYSGKMRLELVPLFGTQQHDALFQEYDDRNMRKVCWSFRQPPLLTGDTRDMNRSTSVVAKSFAEEQIYQPARDAFDEVMNRHFLSSVGVRFWRFKTNAPVQRMPSELVANVTRALKEGGMVPNEARPLLADAFSIDLPHRDEQWAKVPPALSKAAAQMGETAPAETHPHEELEGASKGEIVARGITSEADGHDHRFVATRMEDALHFFVFPAAGHSHTVSPIPYAAGKATAKTEVADGEHAHDLSATIPLSRRAKRAVDAARALSLLRDAMREAVEEAKDEWLSSEDDGGE